MMYCGEWYVALVCVRVRACEPAWVRARACELAWVRVGVITYSNSFPLSTRYSTNQITSHEGMLNVRQVQDFQYQIHLYEDVNILND